MENMIEKLYLSGFETQRCTEASRAALQDVMTVLTAKQECLVTAESEKHRRSLMSECEDLCDRLLSISSKDSFVQGFKFGARLACEVFSEEH